MADNLSKVSGNKVEHVAAGQNKIEQAVLGPHVSLLVEGKVTPKCTMLWLSQLFDSFNILQ